MLEILEGGSLVMTPDTIFIGIAIIMFVVQFILIFRTLYIISKPQSGPFDLCLVKEARNNCRIWSVVITGALGLMIAYRFAFIFIMGFSALMTLAIFLAGKSEEK